MSTSFLVSTLMFETIYIVYIVDTCKNTLTDALHEVNLTESELKQSLVNSLTYEGSTDINLDDDKHFTGSDQIWPNFLILTTHH